MAERIFVYVDKSCTVLKKLLQSSRVNLCRSLWWMLQHLLSKLQTEKYWRLNGHCSGITARVFLKGRVA